MATHIDDDDDLWELAELYVDLYPPRCRANPSSFVHDFKIPEFCKQFGIHDNESSIDINIHVCAKLAGHDVT